MRVDDGARREPLHRHRLVGGLDVRGPQLGEQHAADGRRQVEPDQLTVAAGCLGRQVGLRVVPQPALQVLAGGGLGAGDVGALIALVEQLDEERPGVLLRSPDGAADLTPLPRHRVDAGVDDDAPRVLAAALDRAWHGVSSIHPTEGIEAEGVKLKAWMSHWRQSFSKSGKARYTSSTVISNSVSPSNLPSWRMRAE